MTEKDSYNPAPKRVRVALPAARVRDAWARAHEVITLEELKKIFRAPSHEMVSRHIHKLIQVISCCPFALSITFIFFLSCLLHPYMGNC